LAGTPFKWCDGGTFGEPFPYKNYSYDPYKAAEAVKKAADRLQLATLTTRITSTALPGVALGLRNEAGSTIVLYVFHDDIAAPAGRTYQAPRKNALYNTVVTFGDRAYSGTYSASALNTWTGNDELANADCIPSVSVNGQNQLVITIKNLSTDSAADTWDAADAFYIITRSGQ